MRLKHTQFYGSFDARCDVAGFSVARLCAQSAEHPVAPHEHEDGHFIVVLEGRYRSSARGAHLPLVPGDVLWNPPGTRHVDTFHGSGGRFLALSITGSRAQALGLAEGGARRLQGESRHDALQLSRQPLTPDLGGLLMVEELANRLCESTRADQAPAEDRGIGTPAWVRRCMEQLVDDCDQALRLDVLARSAGVHPGSLARAFRRHYGIAPGQLQRRAQLNRAAHRLRQGQSVVEVAADLGFADQSHFTRLFRMEYRCTPAAWQKRFKTF